MRLLDTIDKPEQLRELSLEQLTQLAHEIRLEIIEVTAKNGGHLAPNLGVVELTLALHKVFRMPKDKIIWDVGHQCYTHKLLTGRRDQFPTLRRFGGLCGFCKVDESEYDSFGSGHAGTAISAAMGYAAVRDHRKTDENIVAVVGDGSLINGISLEAMNNVRSSCKNMIIVVNDNKMSIARSIGAIPNYLNRIITGQNYNRFKAFAKMNISKLYRGEDIIGNIQKLENSAKNLFVPGILFEEMGIRYIGPINGHQLPDLIQTFEHAKNYKRPVLIHVITEKGHDCEYATDAPERFHGISSFNPDTGVVIQSAGPHRPSFSQTFGDTLEQIAETNPNVVAITAAMASGTGLSHYEKKFHDRFFDVGIAEEHALVFASGIAANGMQPVVAIYATFLQRGLDCIFHDICLQNHPVVICADRAGIVEDGPTHHGIYDLSFLLTMPNLTVMEPKNELELDTMLRMAVKRRTPVVIRYPRGNSEMPEGTKKTEESEIPWGKAEVLREGKDLSIWTYSRDVYPALKTAELIRQKTGRECQVVSARFLKPFDSELLLKSAETMPVVTIEDNLVSGGLGTLAAQLLAEIPNHGFHAFGWPVDRVVPHGQLNSIRQEFGMLPEQLAEQIMERFCK